jgi:two-component system sensor histidine kinase MprB
MTIRQRLTLAAAIAVAIAVIASSLVAYNVVRDNLYSQVDTALQQRVNVVQTVVTRFDGQPPTSLPVLPEPAFGADVETQIVSADGSIVTAAAGGTGGLPVTKQAVAAASGSPGVHLQSLTVRGTHLRIVTAPLSNGFAIEAARSLSETDTTLSRLRTALLLIAAAGIAAATLAGAVIARTALLPVRRLTTTAEKVAQTHDLSERLTVQRNDELGRLAQAFNLMLAALEDSVARQRQLVADASHELRTPLTSLRTNIEVLARSNGMPVEMRRRLLADVVSQLEEMTVLVGDVVDLARGEEHDHDTEDVRLDLLVAKAVERAQRHQPQVSFTLTSEATTVHGAPARIDRAISNLLDNAAKWSPQAGTVEITVAAGTVSVRDHGGGISEDDLPHVFERFYRAPTARGTPGSGLGLAIARQVADTHQGHVAAENPPGGGALFTLQLPESPIDA